MRKERFLEQRRSKLMPQEYGHFHIMERINDNAYKMDLLGEYVVSYLFNVSNLSLFYVGDDLRMNLFKQKENDVIQTIPRYLLKVEVGP
jgi:hypothetical protein